MFQFPEVLDRVAPLSPTSCLSCNAAFLGIALLLSKKTCVILDQRLSGTHTDPGITRHIPSSRESVCQMRSNFASCLSSSRVLCFWHVLVHDPLTPISAISKTSIKRAVIYHPSLYPSHLILDSVVSARREQVLFTLRKRWTGSLHMTPLANFPS